MRITLRMIKKERVVVSSTNCPESITNERWVFFFSYCEDCIVYVVNMILDVIIFFSSNLFSEVAPNERKQSSVPIFVQFPGAPGERSASSCDYVQLRAGEPNEGACMYKFTVEAVVPSFRFLRPTVMKLRHRRRTMIWRSFARGRASTHESSESEGNLRKQCIPQRNGISI